MLAIKHMQRHHHWLRTAPRTAQHAWRPSTTPRRLARPTLMSSAPGPAPRRRLLLLLHGARISDPLVRDAIHGLKDGGHEASGWGCGGGVHAACVLRRVARRHDSLLAPYARPALLRVPLRHPTARTSTGDGSGDVGFWRRREIRAGGRPAGRRAPLRCAPLQHCGCGASFLDARLRSWKLGRRKKGPTLSALKAARRPLSLNFIHARPFANLPDTIVAGGGDGTLNELVAALLRPPGSDLLAGGGLSVAQLPLGTANDLASASGISLVDGRAGLCVGRPASRGLSSN